VLGLRCSSSSACDVGRRVVGRVALSKGGVIFKGRGVPEVVPISKAPSHAAPAPAAAAWYVSRERPPHTDSSPVGDGLRAALRVNQAGTTLRA